MRGEVRLMRFDGRSSLALRIHSRLRRLLGLSGELMILLRSRHHPQKTAWQSRLCKVADHSKTAVYNNCTICMNQCTICKDYRSMAIPYLTSFKPPLYCSELGQCQSELRVAHPKENKAIKVDCRLKICLIGKRRYLIMLALLLH